MGRENLIIRADASTKMGSGHVMRSLALGQAWQDDSGTVTFVISEESRPFMERLQQEGFDVICVHGVPGSSEDARQTLSIGKTKGSEWLVIDGYHFTAEYRRSCSENGLKLMWIDDYGHPDRYYADIILNQNVYATGADYPDTLPSTLLLLGTKYLILRKEFVTKERGERNFSGAIRSVLVTMGGSDPDNVCADVLGVLMPFVKEFGLQVTAVMGKLNPHANKFRKRFGEWEGIAFLHDARDMPSLIHSSDIVITGAGTTTGEIAFLGVPMITIVLGENQKRVAETLHRAGAALCIRDRQEIRKTLPKMLSRLIKSPETRKDMSIKASGLVDGAGAARVIMHMKHKTVRLRRVIDSDCRLLWVWANDPEVRKNAFNQQPINLDSHKRWFSGKRSSPTCYHYIAINAEDIPVGQIRFDCTGERAEIDISVDKKYRGMGLGHDILQRGIELVFSESPCNTAHAYVKAENISSAELFQHSGFVSTGKGEFKGSEVYEFIYPRKTTPRDVKR